MSSLFDSRKPLGRRRFSRRSNESASPSGQKPKRITSLWHISAAAPLKVSGCWNLGQSRSINVSVHMRTTERLAELRWSSSTMNWRTFPKFRKLSTESRSMKSRSSLKIKWTSTPPPWRRWMSCKKLSRDTPKTYSRRMIASLWSSKAASMLSLGWRL